MMEWFAWLCLIRCFSVLDRLSAAVSTLWISTEGMSIAAAEELRPQRKLGMLVNRDETENMFPMPRRCCPSVSEDEGR